MTIDRSRATQFIGSCIFYPFFVAGSYLLLRFMEAHTFALGADLANLDPLGLLLFVLGAIAACGAVWLLVQPERIEWYAGPWWTYGLLVAGFVLKAGTMPLGKILIHLPFSLVVIAFTAEFIYRGCMEEGMAILGPRATIGVTGLLFGLGHIPLSVMQGVDLPEAIVANLVLGLFAHLLLRWLRNQSGLGLPILAHGLYHFLTIGL